MSLVPRLLRAPLLVLLLLGAHLVLGRSVESLRLPCFRVLVAPFSGIAAAPGTTPPEPPLEAVVRLEAEESAARASLGRAAQRSVPILDLDRRRGFAILGCGAEDGARRGALVRAGGGVLGLVDRLEARFCRVRLLGAEGSKLPVLVRSAAAPPGGVDGLVAALEGVGGRALLTESFLPTHYAAGDRVVLLEAPEIIVGRLESAGFEPPVALAAEQRTGALAVVEGVRVGRPHRELFERRPARVVYAASAPRFEALLRLDDATGVLPGSAVTSGDWYCGRVVSVGCGTARALGPRHPGLRTRVVLLVAAGAEVEAVLVGGGDGPLLLQDASWPGPDDAVVYVATAGGDQLVPRGLLLGRLHREGDRVRLESDAGWPPSVLVAAFEGEAARRALLAGRRR